jgi:hypothetical protein
MRLIKPMQLIKRTPTSFPLDPITNFRPLFLFPGQQTVPALDQLHPRPCYPSDRGVQMAAAQTQTTPTETDPVQRWLGRRAAINRANSAHSTGPRTESGKQRSSLNALSHGLTARTAVLPTEDQAGFVFSKQQIERHAQHLMRNNPTYYAAHPRFQADPSPTAVLREATRSPSSI